MLKELKNKLKEKQSVLFLGPVSKNLVDAAIKFVYDFNTFIPLISSRRQIECKELGGGYVNNWTTESYVDYIKEKDKDNRIILCRDHGGPFQISLDENYDKAMENSKYSFKVDIESGFKILHIDTSGVRYAHKNDDNLILESLFELYDYCHLLAPNIDFEIGEESHDGSIINLNNYNEFLRNVFNFCKDKKLPLFSVGQLGNYVKEIRNYGDIVLDLTRLIYQLNDTYGFYVKEHNVDYLQKESLRIRKTLGIYALNIAPEFGYAETMFLIKKLIESGEQNLYRKFLEISYESKKWQRWLVNQDLPMASKALISGHYVFSNPEVIEIKQKLNKVLDYNIDEEIVNHLSNRILQYYIDLEIL